MSDDEIEDHDKRMAEAIKKLADTIGPILDQFIRSNERYGIENDDALLAAKEAVVEFRRLIE